MTRSLTHFWSTQKLKNILQTFLSFVSLCGATRVRVVRAFSSFNWINFERYRFANFVAEQHNTNGDNEHRKEIEKKIKSKSDIQMNFIS